LAKTITQSDGTIVPLIEFVELRLGNLCNLRCVTCNPLSSSQWRSDYLKLAEKFDFLKDKFQMLDKARFTSWPTGFADSNVFELDWPESEIFWEELGKLSENLKVIYINGGEPTLIKKHWNFLEYLIQRHLSKNIELNYSINVTNLPEYADEIWKYFKKVRVSCSIDALEERNNYIRFPSNWQTILNNFTALKQSSVEVSITQTISVLNYDSLDKFVDYFKGHHVHYNFLTDPVYYSPAVIPQFYRNKLHERYKTSLPQYLYSQLVKAFGDKEHDLGNMKRMLEVTATLDQIRNTSFSNTFPELAQALESR